MRAKLFRCRPVNLFRAFSDDPIFLREQQVIGRIPLIAADFRDVEEAPGPYF